MVNRVSMARIITKVKKGELMEMVEEAPTMAVVVRGGYPMALIRHTRQVEVDMHHGMTDRGLSQGGSPGAEGRIWWRWCNPW